MKKLMIKYFFVIFYLSIAINSISHPIAHAATNAVRCSDFLFDGTLYISHEQFEILTNRLRATLSGKLATVFRSEWKTKLSIRESNDLVNSFIQKFLSRDSQRLLLKGLDTKKPSFTRMVHKRLYEAKDSLKEKSEHLDVRDAPPPPGAMDTTFTFYLKGIKDSSAHGEGKHQVRIRNYVRMVNVSELPQLKLNQAVTGFSADGSPFEIQKISESEFKVGNPNENSRVLSLAQIQEQLGTEIKIFAPHGGKYKLEVKTSLLDKISGQRFEKLGGYHMVQKLDVSLTPQQMAKLFGPLKNKSALGKRSESVERIENIKAQLIRKNPETEQRIIALFEVLREGVMADSDYLQIEGATWYHRSAFESDLGFQLTVDRRQRVTHHEVYFDDNNTLSGYGATSSPAKKMLSPMEIMDMAQFLYADSRAARHVELKIPFFAVQELLGLEFSSPETVANIQTQSANQELIDAVQIYDQFVKRPDHEDKENSFGAGKFHFLLSHGQKIEDVEGNEAEEPN